MEEERMKEYMLLQGIKNSRIFFDHKTCSKCCGSGYNQNHYANTEERCPECGGSGKIPIPYVRNCSQDPFLCSEGGVCNNCSGAEEYIDLLDIITDVKLCARKHQL